MNKDYIRIKIWEEGKSRKTAVLKNHNVMKIGKYRIFRDTTGYDSLSVEQELVQQGAISGSLNQRQRKGEFLLDDET